MPNPRNNDAVVDKMVGCIKEFGFRTPIVAKSDGSVVDGHLRLKAARKLGLDEVSVVISDNPFETEKIIPPRKPSISSTVDCQNFQ